MHFSTCPLECRRHEPHRLDNEPDLWSSTHAEVHPSKVTYDEMITGTTTYDAFGDADFVIEAVPERMEIKQAVFAELDEVTPGHAILASNTSALSISEIGSGTTRPDQVVGFHFFYPASVMRLIEVVEGEFTSEETSQAASNFAMQIRKNPIRCGEEPGFVVNRVLNSAASEIWQGWNLVTYPDQPVWANTMSPMA